MAEDSKKTEDPKDAPAPPKKPTARRGSGTKTKEPKEPTALETIDAIREALDGVTRNDQPEVWVDGVYARLSGGTTVEVFGLDSFAISGRGRVTFAHASASVGRRRGTQKSLAGAVYLGGGTVKLAEAKTK